jgi:ubiquinone biosynthesis protein UbiJ
MTPALLCAAAEIALNRYLGLEPAALEDCAALAGRGIGLHASDLNWTLVLEPHAGGVRVAPEGPTEVRVSAPGLRLLRLGLRPGGDTLPAGLDVEGDTELLRRFQAILAKVGFDPEELAARLLGDGAAHRVVGGLRGLLGWGRRAGGRLSQDTAEYLVEETGDLARGADVADWMDAVDSLRAGVDRLEARLARLEQA